MVAEVWSWPVGSCLPVRGFPSDKGPPRHVGRWWTATTDGRYHPVNMQTA